MPGHTHGLDTIRPPAIVSPLCTSTMKRVDEMWRNDDGSLSCLPKTNNRVNRVPKLLRSVQDSKTLDAPKFPRHEPSPIRAESVSAAGDSS